jgi:hypothetical protein
MIRKLCRTGFGSLTVALLISLSTGNLCAENLNPEAVNPHAAAPRKRISLEQKKAAAEARKTKQSEIAARKAARRARTLHPKNPTDTGRPAGEFPDK